jgi:hypothetical protein
VFVVVSFRKINNDTYYDNLGRVQRASLPYFVDEQSYFVTTQYFQVVLKPLGPLRVRMLPVLASKVLVSK